MGGCFKLFLPVYPLIAFSVCKYCITYIFNISRLNRSSICLSQK